MALELARMADSRWQLLGASAVVAYVGIKALGAAQDSVDLMGPAMQHAMEFTAMAGITGSLALAGTFVASRIADCFRNREATNVDPRLSSSHRALFEAAERTCASGALARFSEGGGWLVRREGGRGFETMSADEFKTFEDETAAAGRELTRFELSTPKTGAEPTVTVRRFVGGMLDGVDPAMPAVVRSTSGQSEAILFQAGRRIAHRVPDPEPEFAGLTV